MNFQRAIPSQQPTALLALTLYAVLLLLPAYTEAQMVEATKYIGTGGYFQYSASITKDACSYEYWYFKVAETEIKAPGRNTSTEPLTTLIGYTYLYNLCTDTQGNTRNFNSEAPRATGIGLSTFAIPTSARNIRAYGVVVASCTHNNDTMCPPVMITINITSSCVASPTTSKYTFDVHYPGNRLTSVLTGTYCAGGFSELLSIKDGDTTKTGVQADSNYGYDTQRSMSRYRNTAGLAGR